MSDRAFVYGAIIVGTLAISLDFASVDSRAGSTRRAIRTQFGKCPVGYQRLCPRVRGFDGCGWPACRRLREKERLPRRHGHLALASLLGGMAWSGGSVIGFRVLQGVGAALLWPAMIGMATAVVGESNRAFALGLIFGTGSLGNSAGPVVGGPDGMAVALGALDQCADGSIFHAHHGLESSSRRAKGRASPQ